MSFDFLSAIKNIAPMLAGTFGTPLAGLAVKAICGFIPDPAVAADVQATQATDPASALAKIGALFQQGVIDTAAVKQAEIKHVETMAELGYKNVADLAAIDAGDRDSARRREIAVKDNTPAMLAWLVIFATVAAGGAIIAGISPAMKDPTQSVMLGTVIGYLFSEAKQILAYYFGSSVGSKDKDSTIADIAKGP